MTENLKLFWSNLDNVKNASPENIQNDILAYLEEIEYLRSWKKVSEISISEMSNVINQKGEQLQLAKQERDEWVAAFWKEHAANTEMWEALEWYADAENYEFPEVGDYQTDNPPVWDEGGEKARLVLSRYPKEGERT